MRKHQLVIQDLWPPVFHHWNPISNLEWIAGELEDKLQENTFITCFTAWEILLDEGEEVKTSKKKKCLA
jgi:hypothetical protein